MTPQTVGSQVDATTLIDVLRWRALHEPELQAYTFLADGEQEELCLTYKELDRHARRIATFFHSIGAHRKPVLLMFPSGLEFIAAFFGCLYAGSIAVTAYPPRPNRSLERFAVIARNSGAKVVITQESIRSRMESSVAEMGGGKDLRWITLDNIDDGSEEDWTPPDVDHRSLAFLQYTSGSTARPKGTMISHGNIMHNSRMISDAFQHTTSTVAVGWLPMTHDMGLIGYVLQPLYVGFRCILMSPEHFLVKPVRWLRAISRYKATTSGGPDFAYDYCSRKIKPELRGDLDLSSWDLAFTGAEHIRPDTIGRFSTAFEQCGFRREAFYPCYGLAESTLMVTGGAKSAQPVQLSRNNEKDLALIGCGRPWLDQKVIIVDPDTCRRCSDNHVGEIWISGSSVAQGYWRQSQKSDEIFHCYLQDTEDGPYLRSGDLGFIQDGELFISGRLKDIIIIGGTNHFPIDIEITVENCHQALRTNCVAAVSIESDGAERLVIVAEIDRHFLTTGEDQAIENVTAAIRQAVSQNHDLATQAICLIRQSTIAKTSSGKIQRHVCRKQYLSGELVRV